MATAERWEISVFRGDPLQLVFGVIGFDLSTAVSMDFAVRLRPDTPGSALLSMAKTSTPGAVGVRCVDTFEDDDGVVTSLIEIIDTKAHMDALPDAVEVGDDARFAYDFQWELPADGSGLTSDEQTILYGDFVVKGSVNG